MNDIVLEIVSKVGEHYREVDIQKLHGLIEGITSRYTIEQINVSEWETNKTRDIVEYFISCKKAQGCTDGTLALYRVALYRMYDYVSDNFELININQLRTYIADIIVKYKNSTASNKVIIIKSFFKWCNDEGYTNNIANKIVDVRVNKGLRKPLTDSELEAVRSNCVTLRERALLEFLLTTGCRISEVKKVTVEEALKGKTIIRGKYEAERLVYINEKSMYYIKKYIDERKCNSNILFTTNKGEVKQLSIRRMQQMMNKIGKRCDVHLHPHIMRHTIASRLLRGGASISSIQKVLGHTNISTTEIYAKTDRRTVEYEHLKYGNI